jgi:UDP-N-acetylmuramoyl-tripeptide--D-alanyl-D-alanine ligase
MAEALWQAEEAKRATGGTLAGGDGWTASGISIDTRTLERGDLFVALTGEARDGHEFVAHAFEKGAVAALVSRVPEGCEDKPCLVVDDTLEGLRALARHRRAESKARIIAVTGSVGKTGTKEALRLALTPSGETHAAVKSYNNHWGVPLTLARMPRSARYGVIEIGMNHAGEITPLTKLARPHVAIITTVAPVHIEFFSSVEEIADAKAEIFEGLEPDGTAILNADSPFFDQLAKKARKHASRIVSFGEEAVADARVTAMNLRPDMSCVSAAILGEEVTYKLGAPGRHLVLNSLAVLAAVRCAGADLALGAMALAGMRAPEGRGARHEIAIGGGTLTLIDESYNANPASMAAAIALLGQSEPGPRGRRIAVLGDMLELGARSPVYHAELAAPLAEANVDLVFCSGPLMAHLWQGLPDTRRGVYGASAEDIAPLLAAELRAGDVVMVKGSLGSRMRAAVEAILATNKVKGAATGTKG